MRSVFEKRRSRSGNTVLAMCIYSNLLREDEPHTSAAFDRERLSLEDRDNVTSDETRASIPPDSASGPMTTEEVVRNG